MYSLFKKTTLPTAEQALPGRQQAIVIHTPHAVTGQSIMGPFPEGLESAIFGMGCFWGAERKFWQQSGVYSTAVGYTGGHTPNPSYQDVCTGQTGHAEVVLVIFDPRQIDYQRLLTIFWESHDPTQGMRQGNDIGTQYRSVIHTFNAEQHRLALQSLEHYQTLISQAGLGAITTIIEPAQTFYYAEAEHQQYLAKNPLGYCGLNGLGVTYDPNGIDSGYASSNLK